MTIPKKFSDQQLIELFHEGLPQREIANKLGVHRNTVITRLAQLGCGQKRKKRSFFCKGIAETPWWICDEMVELMRKETQQ